MARAATTLELTRAEIDRLEQPYRPNAVRGHE